ncbi:MAG: hypothetical protein A2031_09565 [Deltaproteobacteria bacterium RBG_19FT_COMBO_43_11]|nr:MAG: hypothetical protein A2W27_10300 [Deltaproteobacteria bacterium RBG_16_44_11]OGP88587.1 MAG: hypothetical protein A2031_09565 [Deltaproteobacteria bacterium RBG_19FT_COMBO_43_11]
MMIKDRCLIVFVKYPQTGFVKTRIARRYGDDFAAGLYKEFVFDILEGMARVPCRLQIYFDPPEKENSIKNLLGHSYQYLPQQGFDLGEKMKNAFGASFAGDFKTAVLIGSDCPDLPRRVIDEAFDALDHQNDAVIGPASDGGYYLIGFKKNTVLPDAFWGLSWGTPDVFSDAMNILRDRLSRISVLQEWRDVDTGKDLADLFEKSKSTTFAHSRTMRYLKKSDIFR